MSLRFGPAGLGGVKEAESILEEYYKKGLRACEISFTYGVYIKNKEDALRIKKKAKELDITLSIHAPYYINLNSSDEKKIFASKKRILDCCIIGELLGVKTVVFHPGFYGKNKNTAYEIIKKEILDIKKTIKNNKWNINIAPEIIGKVNVFGSLEEISKLVKETKCSFCLDYAHILARYKEVDYKKIEKFFPYKKWHLHFSGIIYNEKGERHHRKTKKEEWINLIRNLPKNKDIIIINESPDPINDSINGLNLFKK